ncbi:hypothetical protein [Raineyella fluvialis]|uniref:Uncharacterized protein n=1 Tax=Raineyella fluvialis TaxID=2662261 RepID=A0A5Q2FEK6_9ACTN|nr:hypothetical protein [Raineyella fluvialis]QGF22706.1 hypothetical protein Rai3103_02315 [Raineyella fluvialis]
MSSAPDDRPQRKRLGDLSPADLVGRGIDRAKLIREVGLWVVALLSAAAGALALQYTGQWSWSIAAFAVTLTVTMVARSLLTRRWTDRSRQRAVDAMVADQLAKDAEAARRREERAAHEPRSAQPGRRRPRANPYRRQSHR